MLILFSLFSVMLYLRGLGIIYWRRLCLCIMWLWWLGWLLDCLRRVKGIVAMIGVGPKCHSCLESSTPNTMTSIIRIMWVTLARCLDFGIPLWTLIRNITNISSKINEVGRFNDLKVHLLFVYCFLSRDLEELNIKLSDLL